MAKIILDGTEIREKGAGVSRYTLNLIKALADIDRTNEYVIFINTDLELSYLPQRENFSYQSVKAKPALFWRLFQLPKFVKQLGCDLVHVPSELIPLFGVKNKNIVVTVHEITKLRNRLQKSPDPYEWISYRINEFLFPLSLKCATKILAISHNTKKDLIQMYGVPTSKVHVTWEAAEEKFKDNLSGEEKQDFRQQIDAKEGYVLSFATGDGRENNEIVLKAWKEVYPKIGSGKKLIFAGCPETRKEELKRKVENIGLSNSVRFLGFVSEDDLVKLYQAADLYVDISYYEGFGLQVVEAMACGTPVITSDAASLPEVVGEGGRLVGVEDKNGLTQEMISLLTDENIRKELAEKAKKSAARFSWKETARETLKVWEEVLENHSL